MTADPCDTPGCLRPVRVHSSEDGSRCDLCRAAARAEQRANDRATRCVHLGEPQDQWLTLYGSDEGREAWLSGHGMRTYETVLSGPREGQKRTPAQARSAALRQWRHLRGLSLRHLQYTRKCTLGHRCTTSALVIGTDVTRDLTVRHHLSVVVCDLQHVCRDYAPGMRGENEAHQ